LLHREDGRLSDKIDALYQAELAAEALREAEDKAEVIPERVFLSSQRQPQTPGQPQR